jgi:hypothetical protein
VTGLPFAAGPPLTPDADDARRDVLRELTKPEYVAAQPSWLDRAAQAFWDWLGSIRFGGTEGAPAVALIVLLAVVVVVVVVVLLVYGVPRLNRRSTRAPVLFGDDDARDSETMRTAARAAAARGDLTLAVAEAFRAIARGLDERGDVAVSPGTTANDVARRAGDVFPDLRGGFADAAAAFDGVRYLDRPGTDEAYRAVVDLDRRVTASRRVDA